METLEVFLTICFPRRVWMQKFTTASSEINNSRVFFFTSDKKHIPGIYRI